MVIYLATITSIDTQLCEAAEIDGASIWNRIRHITIPSLVPTVLIQAVPQPGVTVPHRNF